jgi:hypothetical protein
MWTSDVRLPIESDSGATHLQIYLVPGRRLVDTETDRLTPAYVERLVMRLALLRRYLRRHGRSPENGYRQTVKRSLAGRRSLL